MTDGWIREDEGEYDVPQQETPDEDTDESGAAYVYVFLAEGTNLIKIGHARNVALRRQQLQPGCPYPLRILMAVPCTHAAAVEELLHEHCAAMKLNGEWFTLPLETPAALQELAFLHEQMLVHVTQAPRPRLQEVREMRPRMSFPERVLRIIRIHGPLTLRDMQRHISNASSHALQQCVLGFVQDGMVHVKQTGRRVLYWADQVDGDTEEENSSFEEEIQQFIHKEPTHD